MSTAATRAPETVWRQLEALATARAFDCFGLPRREAIWAAGAVAQVTAGRDGAQRRLGVVTATGLAAVPPGSRRACPRRWRTLAVRHLPGIVTGVDAPPLPAMTGDESARADLWATDTQRPAHVGSARW